MKLTFLGTRGEIEARTRRHHRHASLEVSYKGRRLMMDAGKDWLGRLDEVAPRAIVLTHAHPDHAWGLRRGASAPVWATAETWGTIGDYPISPAQRHTVRPRTRFEPVRGVVLEAFTVDHSTRAPAVGYRIQAGRVTVFYAPDLVYIHERADALSRCTAYVGDGASMKRSFVRRRGDQLVGHAPVFTQLGWCAEEGVPRVIITHCGSEIVRGDERTLSARLRRWANDRGIVAEIAYDGQEVILRG